MQSADQDRWDAKYRSELGHRQSAPDPFVLEALEGLGAGANQRALDLAAGTGRHSLELARRGWQTTAWDVSGVGLGELERRAQAAGLSVTTERVDVLQESRVPQPLDLLLCTDFLDRELWQRLAPWVRPGGHALLVTFSMDWAGSKPSNRFRLELGELVAGLPGFETIRILEQGGRGGILARRLKSI